MKIFFNEIIFYNKLDSINIENLELDENQKNENVGKLKILNLLIQKIILFI